MTESTLTRWTSALTVGMAGLCTAGAIGAEDAWVDVSSPLLAKLVRDGTKPEWPGGCSGVVANRTNGEVTVKVVGQGLWRSSDGGENWRRVDGGVVSGRDETGWATTVDQNNPARIASFSLDGSPGWTADGTTWKAFSSLGRNWDYGSVDWAARTPAAIIAAKHETTPPGEVYLSNDGGVSWRLLEIHLAEKRDQISMVGVLDSTTLIYSNGNGIHRSVDAGSIWTQVSSINPQTRIPVLFEKTHYLGTAEGLLVSKDLGRTWQAQGTPLSIWLGPFFGRSAAELLVVGREGVSRSTDAGAHWSKVASLPPKGEGFLFTPNWFGCYAWDPIHSVLYASSMGNPVRKLQLPP